MWHENELHQLFVCVQSVEREVEKRWERNTNNPKVKKEWERVLTKGDRCGRINKLSPREGDALGITAKEKGIKKVKKDLKKSKKGIDKPRSLWYTKWVVAERR